MAPPAAPIGVERRFQGAVVHVFRKGPREPRALRPLQRFRGPGSLEAVLASTDVERPQEDARKSVDKDEQSRKHRHVSFQRSLSCASSAYVERLMQGKVVASMSRPGNPYDNAKADSFMKTLKSEEIDGKAYAPLEDARLEIGAFIASIYNARRLHSALGYKPPVELEADLAGKLKIHPPTREPCQSFKRVSPEGCTSGNRIVILA